MSLSEQWNYLRHLGKLIWNSPEDRRFYLYCFVGALGVVVNLIVMSVLLYGFHVRPATLTSVIASIVAMFHNFLWNDKVTWKAHAHPIRWRRMLQMPTFIAVSAVGIGITALFVRLFVWLGWQELLGQCLGIVVSTVWTFTANNRFTWRTPESREHPARSKVRVTQE